MSDPTEDEVRVMELMEAIDEEHFDMKVSIAISFAKLELFELEHDKRSINDCPGIAQLAELAKVR